MLINEALRFPHLDAFLGVVAVVRGLRLPRQELDEGEHEATLLLLAQRHRRAERLRVRLTVGLVLVHVSQTEDCVNRQDEASSS